MLGALVGVTACCALVTVFEAIFIGAVGALLANITDPLLVHFRVDDAVGATCVHGFGGAWGMIAVGIFAARDAIEDGAYCRFDGLLHGEIQKKKLVFEPTVPVDVAAFAAFAAASAVAPASCCHCCCCCYFLTCCCCCYCCCCYS